jgi:hypothetical protein
MCVAPTLRTSPAAIPHRNRRPSTVGNVGAKSTVTASPAWTTVAVINSRVVVVRSTSLLAGHCTKTNGSNVAESMRPNDV